MQLNKIRLIPILLISILIASLIPANALTPQSEEVNEYSLEVAEFIREKCHGKCDNVIILGDDYVVPSFRRDIKWLYGWLFWEKLGVDKILTDIGYVQRKTKTFAEFNDLFKINYDDTSYEGKNVLIIRPDSPTSAQNQAINNFKQVLINKGYNPDFEEKLASEIVCNDPGLFSDFNGRTIFVFGTEENNDAFNCFPFQAGLENRNSAFIDINPWDGTNYAVIINTDNSEVIKAFTKIIEDDGYQNLKSESAYFFNVGVEVSTYIILGVSVAALVIGSGGTAAPALLAGGWMITEAAVDGADAVNTCYINPDGVGWCAAAVTFAVLPIANSGAKKGLKKLADDNIIKKAFKNSKEMIEKSFKRLGNHFDKKTISMVQKNADETIYLARGADKVDDLEAFYKNLDPKDRLRLLKAKGLREETIDKVYKNLGEEWIPYNPKNNEFLFRGELGVNFKVTPGTPMRNIDHGDELIALKDHVLTEKSILISTSQDPNVAKTFALGSQEGHIFVINPRSDNFIDVDKSYIENYGKINPLFEKEVAALSKVNSKEIVGAFKIGVDGKVIGDFIPNPAYMPDPDHVFDAKKIIEELK